MKSPVVALLVGGNDLADGLEPQNVSTSYQLLLQDIYQKNPQVHVVICAIPPRPYDVELSTIQETNKQLSTIPKSTSNCSFIRKGQPIIDDFDPEDKYPRLHPTSSAKSRLGRIIETVVTTKMKTKGCVKEIRSRDIVFITGETFWGVDDNLQGRNIMGLILKLYRHRFTR